MLAQVKAALPRKFGPVPAWGWLSGLAGGLYAWQRHKAAAGLSAPQNVPPTDAQLAPTVGYGGPSDVTDSGGDTGPGTGDTSGSSATTPLVYDPATDSYGTSQDAAAAATGAAGGLPVQPLTPGSTGQTIAAG